MVKNFPKQISDYCPKCESITKYQLVEKLMNHATYNCLDCGDKKLIFDEFKGKKSKLEGVVE
jgi:ribosomal protein L44E